MKCHYHYYEEKGKIKKIFIPYCMGGEFHGKDGCTCRNKITIHTLEKEEYNEKLKEMKEQIECLEEENKNLRELIESIRKPKPPKKN